MPRAKIDFIDSDTNYTESLKFYPEDDEKALERCEKIKSQLILADLREPLEFLILVTHGFFVQKVPILFEG